MITDALSLGAGMEQIIAGKSQGFKHELNVALTSFTAQAVKFLTPENYANFGAASAANTAAGDGSTLGLAGAANVNFLTQTANVRIGDHAAITAIDNPVKIDARAEQANVVMNGKPNVSVDTKDIVDALQSIPGKVKDIYNDPAAMTDFRSEMTNKLKGFIKMAGTESAPVTVGGTLGIARHSSAGMVTVGAGARVRGADLVIGAHNQNVTADLSYSAGKSGTAGFEGIAAYLGGEGTSRITIDRSAALLAKDRFNGPGAGALKSTANTVLTNLAGAAAWSQGAASVGAAGAVTDYDLANKILAGGTYEGHSLDVNALTDGVINTLSVAGSLASDKTGTALLRPADILKDEIAQPEAEADAAAAAAQKTANENTQAAANRTANARQGTTNDVAAQAAKNKKIPAMQLAGAGSFSLNRYGAETEAKLDGTHVKLFGRGWPPVAGNVNVKAEDASFLGAWSGAAAVAWKQSAATKGVQNGTTGETELNNRHAQEGAATQLDYTTNEVINPQDPRTSPSPLINPSENAPTTSMQPTDMPQDIEHHTEKAKVALAGAAALNVANQKVQSLIEGATIENANNVRNIAQKDGASAAAALPLSRTAAAADQTLSFGGAGAFSFNKAKNEIAAKISGANTKIEGLSSSLYNLAYNSDTQIAGGINTDLLFRGKLAVGAGGTIAVSDLKNDVTAELAGGTYRLAGDVINHAARDVNQITTVIGVSAAAGAKSGVGFEGALASSSIKNDTKAHIEGADIQAGAGKKLDNSAYDAADLNKTFDRELLADGLDPAGLTYRENAEMNVVTKDDPFLHTIKEDGRPVKGSTKVITTALAVSSDLNRKSVGDAAAAAVSAQQNTLAARIEKSTIMAPALNNIAYSDALLINMSGGAAVESGYFSGAGSVSVQDRSDTMKAEIEDSDIEAQHTEVYAQPRNLDVNLAGQISAETTENAYGFKQFVGWQNGAGLAVAFTHLNNATQAHILGTSVKGDAHDVKVRVKNTGFVLSAAAAVNGGSEAALSGALALMQGKDTTLAGIGKSESRRSSLENVNSVEIYANDDNRKEAVAGGKKSADTAAVGGAVAYNEMGGAGYLSLEAFLNDTDIVTKGDKSAIRVFAEDQVRIHAAAEGSAGAGTAAVQGAAATSKSEKDVRARMKDTNVKNAAGEVKSSLSLKAKSESYTGAQTRVLAGAGTTAVGAGVSKTTTLGSTTAELSGGRQTVGGAEILAKLDDEDNVIGVGGAGGGTAAAAGSVAVNERKGELTAKITGGAELDAAHDVVVAARSDRTFYGYAGALPAYLGAAGGAAGISSVVNTTEMTTNAVIEGETTKVIANAEDYDAAKENRVSSQVLDKVPDDNIVNEYVNDTGSINTQNLRDFRQATEYHGVAVSASGTNKSITVATNRSAVGEGVADSGNIVVNTLGGATTAMVDKAQIESKKDVTVAAHDYASDSGVLGTLDGSLPADSRGRASNTTTNSRETIAKVQGLGRTADIRARNFEVEALALHGIANFDVGVSGSSVGVASVNDVTLLKGKTKAGVWGTNAALSGDFAVRADNASRLYRQTLASGGDGVAAGLAVAVVKGESETEAALQGSKIAFSQDGTSKADVSAKNDTQNHYKQLSPSDGAVAAAGSVGVSNFNDTVKTRLQDATIGAETLRARQIDVKAENRTLAETDAYKPENGRANVGVGVNVATLDNQIETSIKGGALFSKDSLTVAANEQRKISLDTMNFGTSAGGNTLNTTVVTAGHEVEDEYKANADGSRTTVTANVGKAYKDANEAIRKGTLKKEHTFGAVSADAAVVEAGRGGKKSQVSTAIKDAHLSAGENLSVTSKEVNDLNVLGVNAALQGMAVNGSFSAANVARNAFLDVENSNLEGKSVEAAATIGGESKIRAIQGSIPLAPAAAAVSIGDWDGEVRARVKGGSLRATDGAIAVRALDEAKTETLAAANGGAAAGAVLVAETHAHTATAVDAGGTLDAADKNIELKANRVDLTDGSLTGKTVVIEATDTITQANTEKSAVRASDKASFTVGTAGKAGGSIHMLSEKNTFGKADVRAADEAAGLIGNVDLVTNAASGLTVNFGAGSAGTLKVKGSAENPLDVRVKNIAENQSLTLEGKLQTLDTDMAFTSGGSLTLKGGAEYTSARNMALTAQEDVTLESGAKLDAENLRLKAGKSVFAAGPLQINGSIAAAGKDVEMKQKVTAGKDLTMTAANRLTTVEELSAANITLTGGVVTVQKEAKAGNNLTLTGGDVTTQKKVTAGKDLTMTGTNSLKTADELSAANITLTGGDVTTQKKVNAGNDMTLTANGKLTAAVLQAQGSIAAAGKDVEMKQQVTAGKDLTMTAANSLTTADEVSAAANMTLAGGDVMTVKKVTAGNDMKMTAANSLTTADEVSAANITLAGGDVTTQKKVNAGNKLTMTATNSLTTADEVSAANITLTGGDITTAKTVNAGNDLTLTAANSLKAADKLTADGNIAASSANGNIDITAAEAKGGIDLKAANGKLTVEALQAKGSIAAAGKDVEMKQATAGSDLTMTAANSLTSADKLEAGGLVRVSQIGGSGDIALHNVKAGSFYAEHSGTGDLRADDVYSQRVGFVHHEGVGDIHLDKMQVGDTARISHTGTGDIFTRYLLAGREAHFLNNNGGMDLGVADGGRRLTITALSNRAKVRANVLRAGESLTIFALNQEVDQFDAPSRLDLIHSGDQTRRAVDWRGAAELGSLFETYWRRYEPVGAESFIDLRSWERTFSESVESNETGEEAVNIGEDA